MKLNTFLKNPTHEYQEPHTRRLQTIFSKCVKTYKEYLIKFIKENHIHERITIINNEFKDQSLTLKDMT